MCNLIVINGRRLTKGYSWMKFKQFVLSKVLSKEMDTVVKLVVPVNCWPKYAYVKLLLNKYQLCSEKTALFLANSKAEIRVIILNY